VLDIEKSHEVLEVDLVSGYFQPEAFFLVPKVVLEVVVKPPGAALQERHTAADLVPQLKAKPSRSRETSTENEYSEATHAGRLDVSVIGLTPAAS
jgi:hypothetical protein